MGPYITDWIKHGISWLESFPLDFKYVTESLFGYYKTSRFLPTKKKNFKISSNLSFFSVSSLSEFHQDREIENGVVDKWLCLDDDDNGHHFFCSSWRSLPFFRLEDHLRNHFSTWRSSEGTFFSKINKMASFVLFGRSCLYLF